MDGERADLQATDQFAIWITQRRDLLAQILRTTLQQQAALEEGLVDRLLATLEEKDALVNQLRQLQDALKPYAEVEPADRQWRDQESRSRCRREIEETEKLQRAILDVDARCEQAMLSRREELFHSMQQTTGVALASQAYAAGNRVRTRAPSTGSSIDLTSG